MSTGFPYEPGSREPGLEHLVKALTADGHPHELKGRDAAVAAFRAARRPPRRAGLSARLGLPARLGAVAAALVAAFAGVTAAAYAQALPAPVQHIAYSVLAPFGVPNSKPSPPATQPQPTPAPTSASPSTTSHGTPSPSAAAPSCPCAAQTSRPAARGSILTIAASRAQLPANGFDLFSGKLTDLGHPEAGVRLRLLEQVAGAAGWQQAGSGMTGGHGGIRVRVPHLTQNATFRLAGPDGVASPAITVTVIPRVLLWRGSAPRGTDRLLAEARFGDAGDAVVLQELSGGTWEAVASGTLNPAHRASFDLPAAKAAGQYYRVLLRATGVHGASVSAPVREPRVRAAIGASAIVPQPTVPAPVLPDPGKRGGGTGHRVTAGPVAPSPMAETV
ncbi:hypothetical protein [Trebonia sp.]|uniref:hypothetical protein n=1 Tax=Trebonia sp. TaxID=2767075 RepID=UPI00263964B7|nr:hypothetical protein [Trebonia sp.]